MSSSLGSVLEQIKHCEKFVQICDKVMHLERMQAVELPQRRENLLDEKLATTEELRTVCLEHEYLEAALRGEQCLTEELDEDTLTELIKTAVLRMRLLRKAIDKIGKQIDGLEQEAAKISAELVPLYQSMDSYLELGFEPDSAKMTLKFLIAERERIRATIKAEMSGKKINGR